MHTNTQSIKRSKFGEIRKKKNCYFLASDMHNAKLVYW